MSYLNRYLTELCTLRNISSRYISTVTTALIQSKVTKNKQENLQNASRLIEKARKKGAELIILPEFFNMPCDPALFNEYAEEIPDGPSSEMLSDQAKRHKIYLVGGTICEREGDKLYNACTVWNPEGQLITKYRKIHLFDVDIFGELVISESEYITPGNNLRIFKFGNITAGLGICYDVRFEEQAKLYRILGCNLLIYTGAFSTTTGPLHWELTQRSRANDNQVYVCGVSTARGDSGYIAWGYSQITDPWGRVIANAGYGEEIIYGEIDVSECDKARKNIPIYNHRRLDVYGTFYKNE